MNLRELYGNGFVIDMPFEFAGPVALSYDAIDKPWAEGDEIDTAVGDINEQADAIEVCADALALIEKGESLDLIEGVTIGRTSGETGRFKLRVDGQRTKTITGAYPAARVLVEAGYWRPQVHPRNRRGEFVNTPDAPDVDVDALHRLPNYGTIATHDGISIKWVPKTSTRYGTGEKTGNDGYSLVADGVVAGFVKNAEDVPARVAEIRAKRTRSTVAPPGVVRSYERITDAKSLNAAFPDTSFDPRRYIPPFSPEVAKIKTGKDCEAYLAKLGLDKCDFTLPKDAKQVPDADWYQQVAQATHDVVTEFPGVLKGPTRLAGIRFNRADDEVVIATKLSMGENCYHDIWGQTGPDPQLTDGLCWLERTAPFEPWKRQPGETYISISPWSDLLTKQDNFGFCAISDSSIYGRLMHEMGHVTSEAQGIDWKPVPGEEPTPGSEEAYALEKAGLPPSVVGEFSEYAASDSQEGLAEVFAMVHVPHALDDLALTHPKIAEKIRKAVPLINKAVRGKVI